MGFKTSEKSAVPYAFGQTPFTIVSAKDDKTSAGEDMLRIICEITDSANRSGKFTAFIFGNQKPIYRAFLKCIGKPHLDGQEVDGSVFNGCRGVFLMGSNPKNGLNKVDAWLPFDKERKEYNEYKNEPANDGTKDDWEGFTSTAKDVKAEEPMFDDDIPF